MTPLPYTADRYAALIDAMQHSYRLRTHVYVANMSHVWQATISDRVIGGQIQMDADAEIQRTMELDLFDPYHSLQLDSAAPTDGALYGDRLIYALQTVESFSATMQ
jgi:hypothetical protein